MQLLIIYRKAMSVSFKKIEVVERVIPLHSLLTPEDFDRLQETAGKKGRRLTLAHSMDQGEVSSFLSDLSIEPND